MYRMLFLMSFLFAFHVSHATACGFCVEDKIASVYDHAIVMNALEEGNYVVFCAVVSGNSHREDFLPRLKSALHSIKGVDERNTKFSSENMALAFTYNPSKVGLDEILTTLRSRLKTNDTKLETLRVMKKPATVENTERKGE